jgi:hypothetical protein
MRQISGFKKVCCKPHSPLPHILKPVFVCINPVQFAGHLGHATEFATTSVSVEVEYPECGSDIPLDDREEEDNLTAGSMVSPIDDAVDALARGPHIMSNTRLHVRFIVRSHYEVFRLGQR